MGTMTATMVTSIIIALAAPSPIWLRLNAKVYMKVAGRSDEKPGPPPVSAITRSKLLIAMWPRMISALKKTGAATG